MLRLGRFAVIVSAAAVALLIVEAGLRWFTPRSDTTYWLTTSAQGYALNKRSSTADYVVAPGRSIRYDINSLGFRGAEPHRADTRVLVVGDSVTFGWLLNESDTYVSQIAASAAREWGPRRISFMNAAVAGWGPADYAAFVEDRGDELRPDVLLVFIGFDDVRRAWVSPLWALAPDGTVSRHTPSQAKPGVKRLADVPGYRFLVMHSRAAQLLRQAVIASPLTSKIPSIEEDSSAEAFALMKGLFVRLSDWCRARGIVLLVTNGNLLEFAAGPKSRDANAMFLRGAGGMFAEIGVPYLSVARAHGPLTQPLESLEIPGDGHPNEDGARLIFETVWPWLRTRLQPVVERPGV
jgi:lysophospholipase L1-like esterase